MDDTVRAQAKEQAALVLAQLVESLTKHFGIMKTDARAIVREALQEM